MIVYGRTRLPTVVGRGAHGGGIGERAVQGFDSSSDPGVSFDQSGNGWYSFLVFNAADEGGGRVVVNRLPSTATSASGFQAANTGLPVRSLADFQDKNMIDVDTSPSSPHFGRIYVVWTEDQPSGVQNIVISSCDTRPNGAAFCSDPDNWSSPAQVTDSPGGSFSDADVAAAPNGDLYVVWWNYADNRVDGNKCAAASDCRASSSWAADQTIRSLNSDGGRPIPFFCPILAAPGGRVSPIPSIDVSEAAGNQGRVFVATGDILSSPGTTRCFASGDDGSGYTPLTTDKPWDVFVGSAPNALPSSLAEATGALSGDAFLPWLDVDQSTGAPEAAFYKTDPDASRLTALFSHTAIGNTGTPSGSVSAVATGASNYGGALSTGFDYGDYEQVAAANGKSYPVWTDGRDLASNGEIFALAANLNLTAGAAEGAETSVDTSGSGSSTRMLAGANNLIGNPMLAFLSTNDGASFSGPVGMPLNADLQTL